MFREAHTHWLIFFSLFSKITLKASIYRAEALVDCYHRFKRAHKPRCSVRMKLLPSRMSVQWRTPSNSHNEKKRDLYRVGPK